MFVEARPEKRKGANGRSGNICQQPDVFVTSNDGLKTVIMRVILYYGNGE